MGFDLINDWHRVKRIKNKIKLFEKKWIYDWSINEDNASIMFEAIKLIKPTIVIETGTFEGHGTLLIASAINELNKKATIYTIDYPNDPLTKLDKKKWLDLDKIRKNNLNKIRNKFDDIKIVYLEGDSRIVLPKLLFESQIKWDLFFQDSMHFYEGILSEWNAIKSYANSRAIAIFDDISLSKKEFEQNGIKFCQWFSSSKDALKWNYLSTEIGHHQFWVQRK